MPLVIPAVAGVAEHPQAIKILLRDWIVIDESNRKIRVMPLTGGIVATASVKARRRPASSGSPAGPQDGVDSPRGISVP